MLFRKILCRLPTLMCPAPSLIRQILVGYRTSYSIHELVFEKVERIAKTERSPNKIKISIDSSKIVSAGLFQTVLMHELGHAIFNRRDLTGDIMDFHILQDPLGRLYQHVPYYNKTLNYHPFAHVNGNKTIVPEFY